MRQYLLELIGAGYTDQDIRERLDKITVNADGAFQPVFRQYVEDLKM